MLQTLDFQVEFVEVHASCLVWWNRPAEGRVKFNVDGSYRDNTGRCGGGGVVRDSHGRFVVAFVVFLG